VPQAGDSDGAPADGENARVSSPASGNQRWCSRSVFGREWPEHRALGTVTGAASISSHKGNMKRAEQS